MKKLFLALLVASAGYLTIGPAKAATISIVGDRNSTNNLCWMQLKGEIGGGELSKIIAIVKKPPPHIERFVVDTRSICLNSPGGSWDEGLRIARFFLKQGIKTVIDKDAECMSACAIAFMAGTYNTGTDLGVITSRMLHVRGKLGFHAPFLNISEGNYNKQTVENAYGAATLAIAKFMDLVGEMRFSHSLIAEMLKHGSKTTFDIDTVDKIGRWNITLFGYRLPKRFSKKEIVFACMNNFAWWGKDEFDTLQRVSNSSEKYYKTEWKGWNKKYSNLIFWKKTSRKYTVSGFGYYEWKIDCKINFFKPSEYLIGIGSFKPYQAGVTFSGSGTNEYQYLKPWSVFKPKMKLSKLPEGNMRDLLLTDGL